MAKTTLCLFALITIGPHTFAQPTSVAEHVLWERDYPNLAVSVLGAAVADNSGNLWAVSEYRQSERLLYVRKNGELAINTELPTDIQPKFPADRASFRLAASPSGTILLAARYMHGGREISFDGVAIARVNTDEESLPRTAESLPVSPDG